ncbi:hypothetical protein L2Y90_28530 [Burkholderia pyrrocinia]|uniref:hypothetical protein n=1 Tax=Burkholderia pyrrocinia TaxID=60550 RepID=UPI00215AB6B6|nr:hypothetical protein [Burkholderia pyrrocinia]UVE68053.1 hypothetical protein L2Y90_28530 [Burkholderia pyrrocinia]
MSRASALPMELEGQGAVSMYRYPEPRQRESRGRAATIECLRAGAAPQAGRWGKVKVE